MKNKTLSFLGLSARAAVASLLCLAAGCSTSKEKEKPLESRGWVGGKVTVVRSFPKAMIPRPRAALLVTALSTNTPAAIAGLRPGDLILALDHQPVEKLRQYHRKIDPLKPGTSLSITIYRDGEIHDYTVTTGQENYRRGGTFTVYFPGVVYGWNPWPHGDYPGFSLYALGYQNNSAKRVEIGSAQNQYDLKCDPKETFYSEDYKIWIGPLEFSKGKNVASQQMANAAK